MTDHYLYLDETGTLDFEGRPGERYFGVGTAYFAGHHGDALWAGHQLRVNLEASGVRLTKGLHAKNDSARTRTDMYAEIVRQNPRIDATMLLKERAFARVQQEGKVRLYKLACWIHLTRVVLEVSDPGDRVFVIVGHLTTSSRRDAIRHAITDICKQVGFDRSVIPCIWDAPSSWGIQVADYALWAIQRRAEGKPLAPYAAQVKPLIHTEEYPWGRA